MGLASAFFNSFCGEWVVIFALAVQDFPWFVLHKVMEFYFRRLLCVLCHHYVSGVISKF